jgi:hypothetical protein
LQNQRLEQQNKGLKVTNEELKKKNIKNSEDLFELTSENYRLKQDRNHYKAQYESVSQQLDDTAKRLESLKAKHYNQLEENRVLNDMVDLEGVHQMTLQMAELRRQNEELKSKYES